MYISSHHIYLDCHLPAPFYRNASSKLWGARFATTDRMTFVHDASLVQTVLFLSTRVNNELLDLFSTPRTPSFDIQIGKFSLRMLIQI